MLTGTSSVACGSGGDVDTSTLIEFGNNPSHVAVA